MVETLKSTVAREGSGSGESSAKIDSGVGGKFGRIWNSNLFDNFTVPGTNSAADSVIDRRPAWRRQLTVQG
jgi:hypothetical protein